MKSKKNRIIILSAILLVVIVTGVFITVKNNKDNITNSDKLGNENTEKHIETDEFYYVENFIGEEEWKDGFYRFLKYDEKIVKFTGEERIGLTELRSKENIYEFPNENIRANEWWIDNNIFWNVKYDEKSKMFVANSFDKDGNQIDKIELKDFKAIVDDSIVYIKEMKVIGDYIYILAYDGEPIFQIFDKTGELKNSYRNIRSFDADDKGHCIYSNTKGFCMIDSATGDEIFANSSYLTWPIRFSEDGNFIYGFGGEQGSPRMVNVFDTSNGVFLKSIFDFRKYSTYLLDDYEVVDFMVGKDEEIYCALRPIDKKKEGTYPKHFYYLYTKMEGERPKKETVFTITTPYRYDFMEEAIKLYELKYPEEHVEYDYAYNNYKDFIENTEEYGAKLNLDIISGDVGDIVQTGGAGLNYQSLLRTDAFMDLTDLIIKDKSYQDLNKNVLNGIKINNTIRALPISYTFYQYELNEDLEKKLGLNIDFNKLSWSEVLDLVEIIEEKAPDSHLFTYYSDRKTTAWEVLGYNLVIVNMPDLINLETKEVNLNQEWFKDLLIKFKECSESGNFIFWDKQPDFYDSLKGSLLVNEPIRDRFYADLLSGFDEYNKSHRSRIIPSFAGERNNNRIGYSLRMYSINNRSERKENAWKFLSFLLEEDIQFVASNERVGIPISQKGVDRMVEHATWMHALSGNNIDRYNKAVINNSNEINYLYDMGYMREDLLNAIRFYMNDEMTLDEALKKAEENIIIRLNE